MSSNNWFADHSVNYSVDELVTNFWSQVTGAIDTIFPLKTVRLHPTDKPWMSTSLNNLSKIVKVLFIAVKPPNGNG